MSVPVRLARPAPAVHVLASRRSGAASANTATAGKVIETRVMGGMNERLIGNIVLVIGSIILSLVAVEAGLWIYAYLRGDHFPNVYDAELGWAPKPNARGHDYIWGTTTTTLEDGTRSNGDREVRNGSEPILAVGDSFTWGEKVSDRETWPSQLEKLSGTRVVNGGVGGYGVDQSFLRARRLLDSNRFRTLIFSFIPGDIERGEKSVLYHMGKPYFDIKDGRVTQENVPVPAPNLTESGVLATLKDSVLVQVVLKRTFPNLLEDPQRPDQVRVLDEQQGREVGCALFHELEEVTKSRGSQLIVLLQRHEAETVANLTTAEYALSCLSDPATRVLDLKPALSKLETTDPSRYKRLYISNDGHMTAEGNEFVAREILSILTEGKGA